MAAIEMGYLDSLNIVAARRATALIKTYEPCCYTEIVFTEFKPSQNSMICAAQFLAMRPKNVQNWYYKTVVIPYEEMMSMQSLSVVPSIVSSRIETAFEALMREIEGDCFDYWVRSTRREAGIIDG